MSPHLHDRLSGRERQIMDIIYRRGEATAVEVAADLPDPPSKTAIRTLLRILEDKGYLRHRKAGKAHAYRPRKSRSRAESSKSTAMQFSSVRSRAPIGLDDR